MFIHFFKEVPKWNFENVWRGPGSSFSANKENLSIFCRLDSELLQPLKIVRVYLHIGYHFLILDYPNPNIFLVLINHYDMSLRNYHPSLDNNFLNHLHLLQNLNFHNFCPILLHFDFKYWINHNLLRYQILINLQIFFTSYHVCKLCFDGLKCQALEKWRIEIKVFGLMSHLEVKIGFSQGKQVGVIE